MLEQARYFFFTVLLHAVYSLSNTHTHALSLERSLRRQNVELKDADDDLFYKYPVSKPIVSFIKVEIQSYGPYIDDYWCHHKEMQLYTGKDEGD